MEFIELAKWAGIVVGAGTVPTGTIAILFYWMMNSMLKPLQENICKLRKDVNAIDVRLARVEETIRIVEGLTIASIGMPNPSVSNVRR